MSDPKKLLTPEEILSGKTNVKQQISTGQAYEHRAFGSRKGTDLLTNYYPGLPASVITDQIANAQSKWTKRGNALGQTLTTIIGDTVSGFGYLAELLDGVDNLTEGVHNDLVKIGNSITQAGQNAMPIYADTASQTGFEFFNGDWWATNFPSIGSALSLLIPARAVTGSVSAIGKAASFANKAKKTKNLIVRAKELGMDVEKLRRQNQRLQNIPKAVFEAGVSRHMENMMEATGTYEATYQEALSQGMSESAAKKAAGQAAAKNYANGYYALLTDIPQYAALAGLRFPKVKMDKASFLKTLGDYGGQMGSEAFEEAFQYAISSHAQKSALDPEYKSNIMQELVEGATEPESLTSAVFGALGGGVFKAAGDALNGFANAEDQQVEAAKNLAAKAVNDPSTQENLQSLADDPETPASGQAATKAATDAADKVNQRAQRQDMTPEQKSEEAKAETSLNLAKNIEKEINTGIEQLEDSDYGGSIILDTRISYLETLLEEEEDFSKEKKKAIQGLLNYWKERKKLRQEAGKYKEDGLHQKDVESLVMKAITALDERINYFTYAEQTKAKQQQATKKDTPPTSPETPTESQLEGQPDNQPEPPTEQEVDGPPEPETPPEQDVAELPNQDIETPPEQDVQDAPDQNIKMSQERVEQTNKYIDSLIQENNNDKLQKLVGQLEAAVQSGLMPAQAASVLIEKINNHLGNSEAKSATSLEKQRKESKAAVKKAGLSFKNKKQFNSAFDVAFDIKEDGTVGREELLNEAIQNTPEDVEINSVEEYREYLYNSLFGQESKEAQGEQTETEQTEAPQKQTESTEAIMPYRNGLIPFRKTSSEDSFDTEDARISIQDNGDGTGLFTLIDRGVSQMKSEKPDRLSVSVDLGGRSVADVEAGLADGSLEQIPGMLEAKSNSWKVVQPVTFAEVDVPAQTDAPIQTDPVENLEPRNTDPEDVGTVEPEVETVNTNETSAEDKSRVSDFDKERYGKKDASYGQIPEIVMYKWDGEKFVFGNVSPQEAEQFEQNIAAYNVSKENTAWTYLETTEGETVRATVNSRLDYDAIRKLNFQQGTLIEFHVLQDDFNDGKILDNYGNPIQPNWRNVVIYGVIDGVPAFKVPAYRKGVRNAEAIGQMRKEAFERWEANGRKDTNTGFVTTVNGAKPGDWLKVPKRTLDAGSPAFFDEPLYVMVGESLVRGSGENADTATIHKGGTPGGIYRMVTHPGTGAKIPHRVFSKHTTDTAFPVEFIEILLPNLGAELRAEIASANGGNPTYEDVLRILAYYPTRFAPGEFTSDDANKLRSDIREIVRWSYEIPGENGKTIVKIQPDFRENIVEGKNMFSDENGNFDPDEFLNQLLYIDGLESNGPRFLQVNSALLKDADYMEAIAHRLWDDLHTDRLSAPGNIIFDPGVTDLQSGSVSIDNADELEMTDAEQDPTEDEDALSDDTKDLLDGMNIKLRKVQLNNRLAELQDEVDELRRLVGNFPLEIFDQIQSGTVWGYFSGAAIALARRVGEGTARHEAFHAIFHLAFSEKQRQALFAEYGKKYPKIAGDLVKLEEQMADDFMDYQQGIKKDFVSRVRRAFRKLLAWIKMAIGAPLKSQELFDKIDRGVYANKLKPGVIKYDGQIRTRPAGFTTYSLAQTVDGVLGHFVAFSRKSYKEHLVDKHKARIKKIDKSDLPVAEKKQKIMEIIGHATTDDAMRWYFKEYLKDNTEFVKHIQKTVGKDSNLLPYLLDRRLDPYIFRGFAKFGLKLRGDERLVGAALGQTTESLSDLWEQDSDNRESWQLEVGQVSTKESISAKLRRTLATIPMRDMKGEPLRIEDGPGKGLIKYHDPNVVYNELLAAIGNSLSVQEMEQKLKSMNHDDIRETVLNKYDELKTDLYQVAQNVRPLYLTIIGYKGVYITKHSDYLNARHAVKNSIDINNKNQKPIPYHDKTPQPFGTYYRMLVTRGFNFPQKAVQQLANNAKDWRSFRAHMHRFTKNGEYDFDGKNQDLNKAIGLLVKYFPKESQPAYYGVEGERAYAWIRSSYAGRKINEIKQWHKDYQEKLVAMKRAKKKNWGAAQFLQTKVGNDPILTGSVVLQQVLKGVTMNFALIEGISQSGRTVGTKYSNMSPKQMLTSLLSAYEDRTFALPIFADAPALGAVKFTGGKKAGDNNKLGVVVDYNTIEELKQRERLWIAEVEKMAENHPEVKEMLKDIKSFKDRWNRPMFIPDNHGSFINRQTNQLMKLAKETGLITEPDSDGNVRFEFSKSGAVTDTQENVENPRYNDKLRQYMHQFVMTDMLIRSEMIQLMLGNPAFYKNPGDFYKRAKQIWSPGNHLDIEAVGRTTYNQGYIKIPTKGVDSENHEVLKEILGEDNPLLEPYKDDIELADGGSFIDPFSYEERMAGLGRLDMPTKIALDIMKKGKSVANDPKIADLPDELRVKVRNAEIRILKPFYFGMRKTEDGAFKYPTQVKDSESMLHPMLADPAHRLYNPFYKKLLEEMGYTFTGEGATFKARLDEKGRKDGKYFDKFSDSGAVKVSLYGASDNIDNVKMHQMSYNDWRNQVETPAHHVESEVNLGTQIAKLITGDLPTDDPKVMEFIKLLSQDIQRDKQELLKTFENEDGTFNKEKFITRLQEEVIDQQLGEHYLEALQLLENGETAIPLMTPIHLNRVSALINSFFKNDITKRKIRTSGVSLINVPSYGFDRQPKIVKEVNEKTGETEIYYEAYVTPWNKEFFAKKYRGEDGMPDFSLIEKDKPELLQGIVYRIPTEDKYSMFNIRVKGFLPPDMGGAIVLPEEITKVAGLDFDIDKVFGFFHSEPKSEGRFFHEQKETKRIKAKYNPRINALIETKKRSWKQFDGRIKNMPGGELALMAKEARFNLDKELNNRLDDIQSDIAELQEQLKQLSSETGDFDTAEIEEITSQIAEKQEDAKAYKEKILEAKKQAKQIYNEKYLKEIGVTKKQINDALDLFDRKIQRAREFNKEINDLKKQRTAELDKLDFTDRYKVYKERIKSDNAKLNIMQQILSENPDMTFKTGNFDTLGQNNIEIRFWTNVPEKETSDNELLDKVSINKSKWNVDSPKENLDTAYVFTENINSIGSDRSGGGSAVIRPNPNAIGIITKKYYTYKENRTENNKYQWNANFQDTDADFELFKKVNLKQFEKLDKFDKKIFPDSFANSLASIPNRFAVWLQSELESRYGLKTKLNKKGTGLISVGVENNLTETKEWTWEEFSKLPKKEQVNILDTQDTLNYNGLLDQIRVARRMNVGKVLVGIAAVHNVGHSIIQRYNVSSIQGFYYNGQYYKDLSGYYDIDGKRITENISEILAAVVDNGKDPQAEYFNLNSYTADVAFAMLHAGLPLRTMQLFLTQPSIRKFVREYYNANESEEAALISLGIEKPSLKEHSFKDINEEELLKNIQSGKEDNDYLLDFLAYTEFIGRPLGRLVNLTKQGDVGLGPSLVDNAYQFHRRERYLNSKQPIVGGKKVLLDLNNNYVNVMYQEGMVEASKYMAENMELADLSEGKVQDIARYLSQIYKDGDPLSLKEMKLVFESYMRFLATGSKLYTADNFDAIAKHAPSMVLRLQKKYPDNYFVNRLIVNKDKIVEFNGVIGSDKFEVSRMRDSFAELLTEDEKSAKVLAAYAFFGSGFSTSLRGFAAFVPVDLFLSTDEGKDYIDLVRADSQSLNAPYTSTDPELRMFVKQFILANFPKLGFIESVERKNLTNQGQSIDKDVTPESPRFYKYYSYGKTGLRDVRLFEKDDVSNSYILVDKTQIGVWIDGDIKLTKFNRNTFDKKPVNRGNNTTPIPDSTLPSELEDLEGLNVNEAPDKLDDTCNKG